MSATQGFRWHYDTTISALRSPARQGALDRSWRVGQQALNDPAMREYLERSIERVNRSDAPRLSREEFLAQTEPSQE